VCCAIRLVGHGLQPTVSQHPLHDGVFLTVFAEDDLALDVVRLILAATPILSALWFLLERLLAGGLGLSPCLSLVLRHGVVATETKTPRLVRWAIVTMEGVAMASGWDEPTTDAYRPVERAIFDGNDVFVVNTRLGCANGGRSRWDYHTSGLYLKWVGG
jgi:hypothetical protein